MALASIDLDLEVFHGPFDLLLSLVLRDEVDLLEVDLAEVVLAYVDHLESTGQLDLEAVTEFLVLIAALLLLKSQLMLPVEEEEAPELEAGEAADELLARMLEYHRYRGAAELMRERFEDRARLPVSLGAAPAAPAAGVGRGGRGRLRAGAARPVDRRPASDAAAARPAPPVPARPSPSIRGWPTCVELLAGRGQLRLRRGRCGAPIA